MDSAEPEGMQGTKPGLPLGASNGQSEIPNPQSAIGNPKSAIRNPQSDGAVAVEELQAEMAQLKRDKNAILDEAAKVVVGQEQVIRSLLAAVLGSGHCLLVGMPGLAKTTIVRALAAAMELSFRRIQFTPDLMPGDITGTEVLSEEAGGKRSFRFVRGPIFANVVLADEINRAPPKTQAALLEAMQERQVTCGGNAYPLPDPFIVMATQNPIEQEGTYELPEAQLDRFLFSVPIGYPSLEEEERIIALPRAGDVNSIVPIVSADRIRKMQEVVRQVTVSNRIVSYVAKVCRATRPEDVSAPAFVRELVEWGVGPRGGQYVIWGARALAAMDGRFTVGPDDVRESAPIAMSHRIGTSFQAQAQKIDPPAIVQKLLDTIPPPV